MREPEGDGDKKDIITSRTQEEELSGMRLKDGESWMWLKGYDTYLHTFKSHHSAEYTTIE